MTVLWWRKENQLHSLAALDKAVKSRRNVEEIAGSDPALISLPAGHLL